MSTVRIDKFLWSVRLYKTRSKATEACKTAKVKVNDKNVRPAKTIAIGDKIALRKGPVTYSYTVINLLSNRVGAKLVDEYILNTTTKEELEKLKILKLSYTRWRDRGMGRPTKKDRREIDDFDTNSHQDFLDWGDDEDWDNELNS